MSYLKLIIFLVVMFFDDNLEMKYYIKFELCNLIWLKVLSPRRNYIMEDEGLGMPKMKVWEEGDEVVVQVRISGINEKNLVLEVKEEFLKIEVKEEFGGKVDNEECIGEEWESSSFSGMVSLPCKVVPMLVHHSYDGKVLEVRLKKV